MEPPPLPTHDRPAEHESVREFVANQRFGAYGHLFLIVSVTTVFAYASGAAIADGALLALIVAIGPVAGFGFWWLEMYGTLRGWITHDGDA